MTPIILAALGLGGDPGQKLAILGLLMTVYSTHHAILEELLSFRFTTKTHPCELIRQRRTLARATVTFTRLIS